MQSAIVVADLRKRYGERTVLADIDLEVQAGEVVGLLGPNGAGKSTALAILATLLAPDEGTVVVAGHALPRAARAARRVLGYVPQDPALYPTLTGRENLRFFGRMLGLDARAATAAIGRTLDSVGLAARADDAVATYSGGLRRRLNLACGILHAPRVLLLDEPTAGIDMRSRERLHGAIAALAADGTAVLVSTHDMEEAERACTRTVMLDEGRIVASGVTADLVGASGIAASLSLRTLRPPAPDWLDGLGSVRVLAANGTRTTLALDDPTALPVLLARAARAGGEVVELRFDRPTLADAFFKLTGHALRDGDDDGRVP
ncbi:MAG: ABC transporter ATP-binding protein [Deltaproteobacteria bacterium]|nr:ABC transporter ATP-binding protein [Deltaproteobacteria bacterium]